MSNQYYTYDLESYPNIFTFAGKFFGYDQVYQFEISDRKNDRDALLTHLSYLQNCGVEMVGFNNVGYDYTLIHELLTNPYFFDYVKVHQLSNNIIHSARAGGRSNFKIYHKERKIPQIDLMLINHFDNANKMTSLKTLQFAMRSESLEDLPFKVRPLNDQEKDVLLKYNVHDILETEKFLRYNLHHIDMRREYLNDGVLFGDVLNYSDVKIGTEYLVNRIGRNKCFINGSRPRQTYRTHVEFNRIILPKITFRNEDFNEVLTWFKSQIVYLTKEERPQLKRKFGGLDFHFGVGGVHASAENKIFYSDEDYQIIDIDVEGMYPAVGIANSFAPEHLGETFVTAYKQVKEDRGRYAKGTARNKAMKLAGNGAYGNSNNKYSPFFDTQYTYSVTVNGQLQILQLVELLLAIPSVELIQANTDGITIRIKKEYEYFFKLWCSIWEEMTGLKLEEARYKRMFIRDVNNYISEKMDGKLKRKGAYEYPRSIEDYDGWWNKDYSNLASRIAAEKAMVNGIPVEVIIRIIHDPFDFMLRYKATGDARLYIGDQEQLKTVRYYVSVSGQPMKKVAPPKGEVGQFKRRSGLKDEYFKTILEEVGRDKWDERIHTKNKSKYAIVETSVQSGWKVKECNLASKFDWRDVDWKYYIEEAKKIIIGENNV